MGYDGGGNLDWTFVAGADLSAAANQYKFVEQDSAGLVTVCNAATDKPVGILQNKPKSGEAATVRVTGISKVQADAALTVDTLIGPSADGQADAKVLGTDVTEFVVGRVLQAAAAAGDIVAVTVNCLNPHRGV